MPRIPQHKLSSSYKLPQNTRSSNLLTDRVLYCPPSTPLSAAGALIVCRDLSVSTLPSHKSSDNHTNASRSGISATQGQKLAVQHFLIHLVIQSLICLPLCSSLLVYMHVFHFGKLVFSNRQEVLFISSLHLQTLIGYRVCPLLALPGARDAEEDFTIA